MIVFLIKRLFNAAMVMLVVALMAFMIFRFVGDPIQLMVNEQTTQAEKDALRDSLGLNDPFFIQFARFVGIVGREQPRRQRRIADAAAGIDARAQHESEIVDAG